MTNKSKIYASFYLALLAIAVYAIWANVLRPKTNQLEPLTPIAQQKQKEQLASDTKSWKTFRDDGYGFEFDYPDNFTITSARGVTTSFAPYNKDIIAPFSVDVSLSTTIDSYIESKKTNRGVGGSTEKLGQAQVAGLNAQIIEDCMSGQPGFICEKSLLVNHNGYLYEIRYYSETLDEQSNITVDENNNLATQMLATFRFTN